MNALVVALLVALLIVLMMQPDHSTARSEREQQERCRTIAEKHGAGTLAERVALCIRSTP